MWDKRDYIFIAWALAASIVFSAAATYTARYGYSVGKKTHAESIDDRWHKELVDRGYAHYDKKTGAWEWDL